MDKIIERISQALPQISSAKEAGKSSLSAPAPMKKSKDFGKALEPDEQDSLLWSLILNII